MGFIVVCFGVGDLLLSLLVLVVGFVFYDMLVLLFVDVWLMFKWFNDVFVDGVKVVGILFEWEGDVVIVGIGVNFVVVFDLCDWLIVVFVVLGWVFLCDVFVEMLVVVFVCDFECWWFYGLGLVVVWWLVVGYFVGILLCVEDGVFGIFVGFFDEGVL